MDGTHDWSNARQSGQSHDAAQFFNEKPTDNDRCELLHQRYTSNNRYIIICKSAYRSAMLIFVETLFVSFWLRDWFRSLFGDRSCYSWHFLVWSLKHSFLFKIARLYAWASIFQDRSHIIARYFVSLLSSILPFPRVTWLWLKAYLSFIMQTAYH